MNVKVRFLAHYRELTGTSETVLELPEGATVVSLVDELLRLFPRMGMHRDELIVSVNKKQATGRLSLHEGDEAVLFPPAVGG